MNMIQIHFVLIETQIFVDKLFEAVNTKSYLPQFEQSSTVVKTEAYQRQEKDEQKKEEVTFLLNIVSCC